MARHQAVFDTDHFMDLPAPASTAGAPSASTFSLAKALDQLLAQLPNRQCVDRVVDRFTADIGFFKVHFHNP